MVSNKRPGGAESAQALFAFATNPFMGVLLGGLVTALVQSSSTVTSIIVGMVAGGLPVSVAIPMVMGANLGTTITNTLVSFGHVGNREEFRRAFAAATVHDGFNLLSIAIFLPLEIAFGILERLSGALCRSGEADGLPQSGGAGLRGRRGGAGQRSRRVPLVSRSATLGRRHADRPGRDPHPGGDHPAEHRTQGGDGRKGESAPARLHWAGAHLGHRLRDGGDRRGAILLHHHQPDGAPGRQRRIQIGRSVSVHPRRQHRHHDHGVAGRDGDRQRQPRDRPANRAGAPSLQPAGCGRDLRDTLAADAADAGRGVARPRRERAQGTGGFLHPRDVFRRSGRSRLRGTRLF